MLKEEAGSSVKTSVPWLIFLTRQLQRARAITVETRSEGDDRHRNMDRQIGTYIATQPHKHHYRRQGPAD